MIPSVSAARYQLQPANFRLVQELVDRVGCSSTLAWILVRRGITDPDHVRNLLNLASTDAVPGPLHDPLLLGDMAAAVERLKYAITQNEPIAIYGDYDADGVCATVVAVEALESLGADVRPYLPNRFRDGYGVGIEAIERIAADGARVLVTVDNGISAPDAIDHARDLGLEVIICDHHTPSGRLPNAIIASSRPSNYPFPDICATVVVGKLALALGCPDSPRRHELEAIATIADCMPLIDENRTIVMRGLAALRSTDRPGLRALLSACDVHPRKADEETVGFRIAPRLNAAGRIDDPERAYELLSAIDADVAQKAARKLHELNEKRRELERGIVAQALEQIEQMTPEEQAQPGYVVWADEWHEGVVGIVASRIAEKFHRPAVVIAGHGALWRGSARSVNEVNLHDALGKCADLLNRWGGHAAAAGVTIEPQNLPQLRARFGKAVREIVGADIIIPVERPDAVLSGSEMTLSLVEELRCLAPFGEGNPRPQLLVTGARISDLKPVGDGSHLKCSLSVGGRKAPAIAFGQAEEHRELQNDSMVDAVVAASVNSFRGSESLQLEVARIIPVVAPTTAAPGLCTQGCDTGCTDRTALLPVVAQALSQPPTEQQYEPVLAAKLPLEPLLVLPQTVDLRHAGTALAHISRLLTAQTNIAIVCADVSRRRLLLHSSLQPTRLGVGHAALLSGRCTDESLLVRAEATRTAQDLQETTCVLIDYATLQAHPSIVSTVAEVLVVLDPPTSHSERDALIQSQVPSHLVFGATEQRFSDQVAQARTSDRQILGPLWVQAESAVDPTDLNAEAVLVDAQGHFPLPGDVAAAAARLGNGGFLQIDEHQDIVRAIPVTT